MKQAKVSSMVFFLVLVLVFFCFFFGALTLASATPPPQIKTSGPTYAGNGVWVMSYEFSMMLMKVRIREEFILEEGTERVKDLRRVRV